MNEHEDNGAENAAEPKQELVLTSNIGAIVRAEIDTQIATAKAYPRSVALFKKKALGLATEDQDTAESCFYAVPRGGKKIEGPSIRLAEIVGYSWGNLNYGSRIIADDGKMVTAQGVCHDLESNVRASVEINRRVTNKQGKRYNDDLVILTSNAAAAIALRNAIFKVVPFAL